jgi:two-component system, chemotaxis family, CheB/CheR fusion protein
VDDDPSFERLLNHLKEARGLDFTGYKRASLMRRVRHQMAQVDVEGFDDYLGYVRVHPEEHAALVKTILISVTGFFRDAEAWQHLRGEIVPDIVHRKADEPIRVWSAGCASGQEAYGMAMCFSEAMGPDDFRDRVRVYATDIDREAVAQARTASYVQREIRGLPADLMTKYVEPVGQRYTVREALRRAVTFSRHDLVQDTPICGIDLLLCRNTLIYFNAETQARVLSRLHLALNPAGVLFLGRAELLLGHALFRPIGLERRFFRKVAAPTPRAGTLAARRRSTGPARRRER